MNTANIPPPSSEEDLPRWILEFESAQNLTTKPRSQLEWADQAIIELKDSVFGSEMDKVRRLRHSDGMLVWPWDQFKVDLRMVVVTRDKQIRRLKAIVAHFAGAGLIIGGGAVLFPSIAIATGFTPGGVAAGSLAASIQSVFYGGATTGLFSLLQSVGATAAAPAAPAAVATIVTAVGSIAAGAVLAGQGDKPGDDGGALASDGSDGPQES